MSKQIYFLHLEADIDALLQNMEAAGGLLYFEGAYYKPTDVCESIRNNMGTWTSQYCIVSNSSDSAPSVSRGVALEFLNCVRGTPASPEYQLGRLCLFRTAEDRYAPELNRIYSKLASYIKRQYQYSSACSTYFSPGFLEQIRTGAVIDKGPGKTFSSLNAWSCHTKKCEELIQKRDTTAPVLPQ